MGTIHPFPEHQPFDSETARAMGLAFDRAWEQLSMSWSGFAASAYAEVTREALATYIIDLANRGERDPNRLRDQAVAFVRQATERKAALNGPGA